MQHKNMAIRYILSVKFCFFRIFSLSLIYSFHFFNKKYWEEILNKDNKNKHINLYHTL